MGAEEPVLKNCRKTNQATAKKETCHRHREEKRIGLEIIYCQQHKIARNS